MSAKENKQLIRQTIEAWNTANGDVGKMRSFLGQNLTDAPCDHLGLKDRRG